ncbi:putative phage protein (TIGR01671 family) [Paenibacillus sp. 1182]|uniref:YopX family protein n=1 Tax=Paenibacillus sp. 1182 TaxID=2806565 RepID=UPI001AE56195|nr:YopX family protein [Paenibacillus sp. 1182]MBP1312309.1 putative phage protein (TIGR01671 family) [Paenibacillus sp. 1182]
MSDTKIKFKWWNKEDKVMLGPELDDNFEINIASKGALFLTDTSRQDEDGWDWEMDVVWLRFTGSTDKNGEDIYDGDVLKIPDLYETPENTEPTYNFAQVSYENGSFLIGGDIAYDDWEYLERESEVIGNIHDNPELLQPQGGGKGE